MRWTAVALALVWLCAKAQAQDISGTWQGVGLWGGKTQTQRVIQITRKAKGVAYLKQLFAEPLGLLA